MFYWYFEVSVRIFGFQSFQVCAGLELGCWGGVWESLCSVFLRAIPRVSLSGCVTVNVSPEFPEVSGVCRL